MTDFDEFLRKRNEELAAGARDTALPASDQVKAWQRLKDELRRITQGKRLGTEPFEWSPYPAPYPDFLKLGDVAAVFVIPVALTPVPPDFRIVFGRRPTRADEMLAPSSSSAAIPWLRWLPTVDFAGGVLHWNAKEEGLRLPTPQFAAKVAERLVEYFEEYNAALKTK